MQNTSSSESSTLFPGFLEKDLVTLFMSLIDTDLQFLAIRGCCNSYPAWIEFLMQRSLVNDFIDVFLSQPSPCTSSGYTS